MSHNLSFSVCTKRVLGAVAEGSNPEVCQEVDVSGYEGVRFVALLGKTAEGGTASLKVEGTDVSGDYSKEQGGEVIGQTANVIPGTDDGKMVIIDIYRPRKRFFKATVVRGVANSAIDGVLCELYQAQNCPVAADEKVARQLVCCSCC